MMMAFVVDGNTEKGLKINSFQFASSNANANEKQNNCKPQRVESN
jgi:hypothetical protein